MRVSHLGGCQDRVKHVCVCINARCLMVQPLVWWNCWGLTQACLTWTLFFSFFFSDDGQGETTNNCGWRRWRKNCHHCGTSVRGTSGGWLPHSIFASAALSLRVGGMAGMGVGMCLLDTLFSSSVGGFGYFNFLLKTLYTSAL